MPDYLAPTVWYYCGRPEDLHGFARWNRPDLFDAARYRELWGNPAAPALTLTRIQESLAQHGRSRFRLILEEFRRSCSRSSRPRWRPSGPSSLGLRRESVGRFPGRIESVRTW